MAGQKKNGWEAVTTVTGAGDRKTASEQVPPADIMTRVARFLNLPSRLILLLQPLSVFSKLFYSLIVFLIKILSSNLIIFTKQHIHYGIEIHLPCNAEQMGFGTKQAVSCMR